jgi:hypothetical protein
MGASLLAFSLCLFGIGVLQQAAFACDTSSDSNQHTVGAVFHGWIWSFNSCQSNPYHYEVRTNHGHGSKYVALWHSGTTHLHSDDLESGSVNAYCADAVNSTHHYSWHDIAGTSCTDRFNDGDGFDCHSMEG